MKSANFEDVKKAQETAVLEEDVMYQHPLVGKVHGKQWIGGAPGFCNKDWHVAETTDGRLVMIEISIIKPILKGPSTTPRKPKNRPKKGTKPERKIAIDKGTELKVGDVVEDVEGNRGIIVGSVGAKWKIRYKNLKGFSEKLARRYIKYIILPYQEPTKQEEGPVEETYTYGEWISFDNEESEGIVGLLCQTEHNKVMFTAKRAFFGNRWISPVEVENSWHISKREILQILGEDATNIRKVNIEITVKD